MSTKTTFKRIALVAVAAMGFGMLSVAPSSAYNIEAAFRTISFASAPSTGTIGVESKAVIKVQGSCGLQGSDNGNANVLATTTLQIDVAPIGSNLVNNSVTSVAGTPSGYTNTNATSGFRASDADNGYRNSAQASCDSAVSAMTAHNTVKFTPDVAGTYVIVALPLGSTSGGATWTLTVAAKTPITAATSTLTPSASALFAPKAIGSAAGNLVVVAKNAEDNASSATTSASVSGPGLVSFTNNYQEAGRAISSSGNSKTLYFFADGTSGVSTITVSSGSTVLGTQTVTYYGSVASLTATVKKPVSNAGVTTTGVLEVVARDAAGVVVPSQEITITSGTSATIANFSGTTSSSSQASAGTATIDVAGITDKFGTVALTIKDTATGLVSTTANVIVSSPVAAAVTMAFDKTDYLPGEKATLTFKATDANGLPVANQLANSGDEFSWVANLATTTSLPAAAAFSNGSMSVTLFAAGYTGAFSVAAKLVSGDAWATALDDTTLTATANIITDGVAQAAADLAAEATDAANAATDAANAAAEAADAATAAAQDAADAVAALSVQVAEMVDALKKQITALTNLVIKIQKKVKA